MPNKAYLFSILVLCMGSLTACQNIPPTDPIPQPQPIVMPNVIVEVDSDGDGVTNEKDDCPTTPENVVTDEMGCPFSIALIGPLTMEVRAFFDKQNLKLQSSQDVHNQLNKIALKMAEFPKSTVAVLGNMSVIEAKNNPQSRLAHDRAQLVKEILISKGIASERIATFDCADHQQIAPNDTEEATALNRRVYVRMTDGKVYLHELENKFCTEF